MSDPVSTVAASRPGDLSMHGHDFAIGGWPDCVDRRFEATLGESGVGYIATSEVSLGRMMAPDLLHVDVCSGCVSPGLTSELYVFADSATSTPGINDS